MTQGVPLVLFCTRGAFRDTGRPGNDPGLSIEETIEFEMLDALAALDDTGKPAWAFEGKPTARREQRWLEGGEK